MGVCLLDVCLWPQLSVLLAPFPTMVINHADRVQEAITRPRADRPHVLSAP